MPIQTRETPSPETQSPAAQSSAAPNPVLIREGFLWDAQDAYLFDIDGTLLRSRDRIHFNAFASSIRDVTGLEVTLDGVVLHGGTDTAILAEAFTLAGISPDIWEPQTEAILNRMRRTVRSNIWPDAAHCWVWPPGTSKRLAGPR